MCLEQIDCVVLCGGLGARLSSALPAGMPKPLAPINHRTALDYVVGLLEAHSATRVVLAAAYLSEQILAWAEEYSGPLDISVAVQLGQDGTVDALREARHFLETDPVLLCNGDTLTNANLCDFTAQFGGSGVAYLKLPQWRRADGAPGRAKLDSGYRLFSRMAIDDMIASRMHRVEDFVYNFGRPVVGAGTFLDIGTPSNYQSAPEYCRWLDA